MFGWILRYATAFATINWLNHNVTGLHAHDLVTAVVACVAAAAVCYIEDRYHPMPLK